MSLRTIALSAALLIGITGLGAAQINGPWQQDRSSSVDTRSQAYRSGVNDGAYDRANSIQPALHDRGWNNQRDQMNYAAGYRDGYYANRGGVYSGNAPVYGNGYPNGRRRHGDRDRDRDNDADDQNGAYGGYPQGGQVYGQYGGQVYQRAFQDGINDGAHDAQTGHSSRPTKTENYDDTPGYNSSFGDKNQYKQAYREGYVAGYQQGFNQAAGNGAYGQPGYPVYGPQYPVNNQPYGADRVYSRAFQDGVNDGMRDRQTGHSFRPTKTENYDDTPGYDSSMGDKNQYKQYYRQAYTAGYQQGYNGRSY